MSRGRLFSIVRGCRTFCPACCRNRGSAQRGQCYQGGGVGHEAEVRYFLLALRVGDVLMVRSLIGLGGPGGLGGRVVGLTPYVTGHVGRS